MSFLKGLGWAAAGVAAIIAAPATGGASLAVIVGAAGTTTAAGAALGGLGGIAAKHIYDAATDDSKEKAEYYRNVAEYNKAGWVECEEKRKQEADSYQEYANKMNEKLFQLKAKNAQMLEELKKYKFSKNEIEFMCMLAASIAQADGEASEDEYRTAIDAVSLLSADPDQALYSAQYHFKEPLSIEDAAQKIKECNNVMTLKRLGVVLEMVVEADTVISPTEQQLLNLFMQHAQELGAIY